ncbi:MAG: hypothetical protein LWX07_03635 [Bacteroidetes bacterium]|nr:hypothetical protein [Bacteroidota bacterium]
MTEEEIIVLYFQYSNSIPELKNTIGSYIAKRTMKEPIRQFDKFANILLDIYPELDFHARVKLRILLSGFIRSLPKRTIKRYFNLLINSERKFDRRRANEVADLIWDNEIEKHLINNFKKYEDDFSLLPLINNLSEDKLCSLINCYWENNFPSPRNKNDIIKKISKLDIDKLIFLREKDVAFYILALNTKKKIISDKEITRILPNINENNQIYFLWSISLANNWSRLINYINKIKIKTE